MKNKPVVFVLILMAALIFMYNHTPIRDYTNLTVTEAPLPDIAIDVEKEYKSGYMRLLWALGNEKH